MWIHQLFFPLVSESDEDILTRTLQTLAVVRDESEEAVNVDIVFEVNGQNVPHVRPDLSVSPEWSDAYSKIKRIETLELFPQYYRAACPQSLGICSFHGDMIE
jgi:hypothetical protein